MNPLDFLLGPVTDEDKQRALAESLRGRQVAADFFAASSIPALQQMAQQESQIIQDTATQQGRLREALERRRQDEMQSQRYYGLQKELQSARESENDKDRRLRRDLQDQDWALKMTLAQMGKKTDVPTDPRLTGEPGPGYKSGGERDALKDTAETLRVMQDVVSDYDEGYGDPPVWGTTGLINAAARIVPGAFDEGTLDEANWWGRFEQEINIPERHRVFGAALTKTEQPLWERATIVPKFGGEYVRKRLAAMLLLSNRKAEQAAREAWDSGRYSLRQIEGQFYDVLPNVADIVQMSPADYSQYRKAQEPEIASLLDQADAEEQSRSGQEQTGDVIEEDWTSDY